MPLNSTALMGDQILRQINSALNTVSKHIASEDASANPAVTFSAGLLHEFGNSLTQAKTFYSDASRLGHEEANIRLAIVLLKLGKLEEASTVASRVASRNPASATTSLTGNQTSVYTVIGDCLRARGQSAAALTAYRAGLAQQPEDQWARSSAARILLQESRFDDARALDNGRLPRDLDAILKLNSNDINLLPKLTEMAFDPAGKFV